MREMRPMTHLTHEINKYLISFPDFLQVTAKTYLLSNFIYEPALFCNRTILQ